MSEAKPDSGPAPGPPQPSQPAPPRPAPTRGTGPALRRFWQYVRPHKRWLWIGLVMIPVVGGVPVP